MDRPRVQRLFDRLMGLAVVAALGALAVAAGIVAAILHPPPLTVSVSVQWHPGVSARVVVPAAVSTLPLPSTPTSAPVREVARERPGPCLVTTTPPPQPPTRKR